MAGDNQPSIEVFDEETQKLLHKFDGRDHKVHTNKVFVSKISPFNINLVYSGSWDRSVKFWDVRANAMTGMIN